MLAPAPHNKKSLYISIFLHVVILFALIVSFNLNSAMPVLENSQQNLQVVNAMVMDAPQPLKTKPQPLPPKPVIAKVEPKKITPPPPTPAPPKPEPVVKKQAIAILPKKEKKLQQNKIAEQLLSDLRKETLKHKKNNKQKEIEQAFQQEMKQLTAKSLQQQMQQEQKRIAGARMQATQGVVDKYKALILQAISQNWLVPSTVDKKLSAELLIHLAPGGTVLDVQVIKSSGDESLDRSAQAAVFKASPLPVPRESDAFESFRQFVLKVKPENILNSDSWQT